MAISNSSKSLTFPTMSEDELRANDLIEWRFLPDGTIMAVGAMMFGNGRLYINVQHSGHDDCYCYDSVELAILALRAFDAEKDDEPSGWKRHPYTGRRRPGGDASLEYVAR